MLLSLTSTGSSSCSNITKSSLALLTELRKALSYETSDCNIVFLSTQKKSYFFLVRKCRLILLCQATLSRCYFIKLKLLTRLLWWCGWLYLYFSSSSYPCIVGLSLPILLRMKEHMDWYNHLEQCELRSTPEDKCHSAEYHIFIFSIQTKCLIITILLISW